MPENMEEVSKMKQYGFSTDGLTGIVKKFN
jgi:hypothetical protein